MVAAVADLIRGVSERPVHLIGLSFGGMVAQLTVLAHPELVRSLTLMGTAPGFSDTARKGMLLRAETTRNGGMAAVLDAALERWFTRKTMDTRPDLVDRVTKTILTDRPEIHAAIWEQIATFDVEERLGEIHCPTLILVGEQDPSTPPSVASILNERIRGSRMVIFPETSHMVNLEAAEAVNLELKQFLLEN